MNFYKQTFISINITWMMFSLVFTAYSDAVRADDFSSSKTPFIKINKSENNVSVNLVNADLSDVAQMLSKQAEIKIFLDENLSRKITSKFKDMPLEEGVRRLLGPTVSSAFVFSKEISKSGEEEYRLDSVKIFKSGNMLSANFKEIDNRLTEDSEVSSTAGSVFSVGSAKALPQSPEAVKYEIMLARKNLDVIRRKSNTDLARVNEKIADLERELNKKSSFARRTEISDKLNRAENELMMLKASNSSMMLDEEKNLRELLSASHKAESQEKFREMMRRD